MVKTKTIDMSVLTELLNNNTKIPEKSTQELRERQDICLFIEFLGVNLN